MKLIAPDELNETQSVILAGYRRFLPSGAVCVNVLLGQDPWDIRPVFLLDGSVQVMRFSMNLVESRARTLASELEGFSVAFSPQQKVQLVQGEGRLFVTRPFVSSTLQDDLETGAIAGREKLEQVVRMLITLVSSLARRSLSHGHLSPANLAMRDGELILLDPILGALHHSHDAYLAPEIIAGEIPDPSADLYSLGRLIRILLGDQVTQRQSNIVDQLLLPSTRQRPPILEVAVAFGVHDTAGQGGALEGVQARGAAGKVVRAAASVGSSGTLQSSVSFPPYLFWVLGALGVVVGGGLLLRSYYPATFFQLAQHAPFLSARNSVEYEDAWASRERTAMLRVAKAAVVNREPAAINTIIDDALLGSNAENIRMDFLRVAFAREWRDELTPQDRHAAIALALSALVPDGLSDLGPLQSLHPGVLLAIAAQTRPDNATKELHAIPLERLGSLPQPIGPTFQTLRELGVQFIGAPPALGLAAIVTGSVQAPAFEALLSYAQSDSNQAMKVLALIEPVVAQNEQAAGEVLAVIRDQGGVLAPVAGWFDLEDLPAWSATSAVTRLQLILGRVPTQQLSPPQYFDLLRFPLESVRLSVIDKLINQRTFPRDGEQLLRLFSTPSLVLTREQSISLLLAFTLEPSKQEPFIAAWFDLHPSADTVLLILLARSNADTTDRFNLEAARFLRREPWKAGIAELKLLAGHPEPLARVLAYERLNPQVAQEREVLKERLSAEKDAACSKALVAKLSVKP